MYRLTPDHAAGPLPPLPAGTSLTAPVVTGWFSSRLTAAWWNPLLSDSATRSKVQQPLDARSSTFSDRV
jgi:hypothetical protein